MGFAAVEDVYVHAALDGEMDAGCADDSCAAYEEDFHGAYVNRILIKCKFGRLAAETQRKTQSPGAPGLATDRNQMNTDENFSQPFSASVSVPLCLRG